MMAVYAGVALVAGLALKKLTNRVSGSLMKKARESKLFHGKKPGNGRSSGFLSASKLGKRSFVKGAIS